MPPQPRLILRDSPPDGAPPSWLELTDPVGVLESRDLSSIPTILEEVEAAAAAGLFAGGFITYEAAPAFDPALVTREPGNLPLIWFGLFPTVRRHRELPWEFSDPAELEWRPDLDFDQFEPAIRSIRNSIAAGDTYQANFTFRMRTAFGDNPWNLFGTLASAQPVPYAAFIDLADHAICSFSPELFFDLAGTTIRSRPMKGTAPRGLTASQDKALALELYNSRKNRAENLMIVDMLRNDLGRVADAGSVTVDSLYDLETYRSVHQLTSSISAATASTLPKILTALFPCASITGAPKVRTMEILRDLESSPRGIYTGTIGFVAPERRAQFNVAIRTIHIDRTQGTAEYGTGAGIVWDSDPSDEYRECSAKTALLGLRRRSFALFETLLWTPDEGFFLLERHLHRMRLSAEYFAFPFDRAAALDALAAAEGEFGSTPGISRRVRLELNAGGEFTASSGPVPTGKRQGWKLALASSAVDVTSPFLYHKTTMRELYDQARNEAVGYDDALLWNQRGQITESTIANVVFRLDGAMYTPPVDNGLLAGTFRQELLANRDLAERPLDKRELPELEALWLVNSVRRWMQVDRVDELAFQGFQTIWRNNESTGA